MMRSVFCAVLFFSFCQLFGLSQPPPPQVMASDENQQLIDEIVEITNFKDQYYVLCTYFIDRKGEEMGWDAAEIEKRKKRMDVDRFIRNNFYNAMASLSSDELKETIVLLKKINRKRSNNPFLLTSYSIQNNLVTHIKLLLE